MKFILWSLRCALIFGVIGCGSAPSPSSNTPSQNSTNLSSSSSVSSSQTKHSSLASSTSNMQCPSKTLNAYYTHQTNLQTQLSKFKGFLHYLKGLPEGIGIRMQRAQMMIQFNRDFLNRLRVMEHLADQCSDLHLRYIKYRTRLADDLGQLVDSLS